MRQYEIIVMVGPWTSEDQKQFGWESIKSHYRNGLDAARDCRDYWRNKNPNAMVMIRDAETLRQAG